jgi:hypothetical protein
MSLPLHVLLQLSASVHPHLLSQGHARALALPENIPNPGPVSPGVGGTVTTLLSWTKWLALAACSASAVIAGGMIAIGSTTQRTGLAERGKSALLWSVIGAVVAAVGIPLVNHAFSIG